MEFLETIEAIEDKIEHSFTIPLWGKGVIDKDEILAMLQDLRLKYPDEMKQAKWVKDERQRIIKDAQTEAANILKKAEEQTAAMIDEHEITKQAYEHANSIIEKAQANSHEIRTGARQYADSMLKTIEDQLIGAVETVRSSRQELKK